MSQSPLDPYLFDPADPRAPTSAQWAAMTADERKRVVDALPTGLPVELHPPEGDVHRKLKQSALSALDDFFRRARRRLYLSSELAVFYPGERSFVPDLIAVLDVDAHDRTRWVVDDEGKGVDFVLEVLVGGKRSKDLRLNVERYSRLGIQEYVVFDREQSRLHAYRLAGNKYERIVPQQARYASRVLELDLLVQGGVLRFLKGSAPLPDADERAVQLGTMLDDVLARVDREAARAEAEAARADAAEARLAAALAEIERLKGR